MLAGVVWCALALVAGGSPPADWAPADSPPTEPARALAELPPDGEHSTPPCARALANGSRGSMDKYLMEKQKFLEKVLFHQRKHHPKFNESAELTFLVAVILPGVLFFVVFLVVMATTADPLKAPYTNTKEGVITPWMGDQLHVQNVKCYPTYRQV